MENIIKKLKHFSENYTQQGEWHTPSDTELDFYKNAHVSLTSAMYIPHKHQYKQVLDFTQKEDIIIDMGAGDLRFALMLSQKAKKVYALELNPELVFNALKIIGYDLPKNMLVICADWMYFPIPKDVTIITCLCNGAKLPKEWFDFKLIIGDQEGIKRFGEKWPL